MEEYEEAGGLINGEDPQTGRAEDARRWIEIYSRLIEFKEELLNRQSAEGEPPPALDLKVAAREMEHLRRRLGFWQERHASLAPLDIDGELGIATTQGDFVRLSRRELQLLRFLLEHPGRYFDAHTLAFRAWREPHLTAEQVRTYIVRLRRRLAEAGVSCRIETQRGRGYAVTFIKGTAEQAG